MTYYDYGKGAREERARLDGLVHSAMQGRDELLAALERLKQEALERGISEEEVLRLRHEEARNMPEGQPLEED